MVVMDMVPIVMGVSHEGGSRDRWRRRVSPPTFPGVAACCSTTSVTGICGGISATDIILGVLGGKIRVSWKEKRGNERLRTKNGSRSCWEML